MKEMNRVKRIKIVILSVVMILMGVSAGCSSANGLKDGFYTAEMTEFSYGWKEYLIIQVKGGKIVSAEYNAKNESGFIKAWDNNYMKNMISRNGIYPNKYTREYVQQLIDGQKNTDVDIITGATNSGQNFVKLVEAVLEQAAAGDSAVAVVD